MNPFRACSRFFCSGHGLAAMEFALAAPLLLLLLFGVIDVTRYVLVVQKTEKFAHTVANVTAQSASLNQATITQVIQAATEIMHPFPMYAESTVTVSSLYRPPGEAARVNWRFPPDAPSQLGAVGQPPVMPAPFTFAERENVIAAEISFAFEPILPNPWFGRTVIYRAAFYAPRFGALTTPPG